MNKQTITQNQRSRRAHRTRARIVGTPHRPRLSVFRSLKHIQAQIIDDSTGRTLASADDKTITTGKKVDRATQVGTALAAAASAAGITKVVFDRGAYRYHGRIKALADAARSGGLEF